jgi:L-aspartate oxidase
VGKEKSKVAVFHHTYLVIGSGMAGLLFALKTAERGQVAVITKRRARETNTRLAQGGIAGVFASDDSYQSHASDTILAGGGLCCEETVASVVADAPEVIATLENYGVSFKKDAHGTGYDMGREGGHTHRRVLHAQDETGRMIQEALQCRAAEHPNITIIENHCAIDLITTSKISDSPPQRGKTRVLGAYVLDPGTGEIHTFLASAVMLATGGCGKIYRYTSNPDVACGDGLAMAYRAGARLANLEFVQFHPTCLYHPERHRFLLSEALRGEGGILRTLSGETFMEAYHPQASLAPRDIVARACDQEMKKQGDRHVLLDLSAMKQETIKRRFPMIYATCLEMGLDISTEPIPAVPAAHYMCGGIVSDENGRTDLPGLYVAGEAACTGLHGANRLASNSLLESGVFALRAAADLLSTPDVPAEKLVPHWDAGNASEAKESVLVNAHWEMIRTLMWNFVGIVRTTHRLTIAKRYIKLLGDSVNEYYWDFFLDSDLIELRNISLVAELIIGAAIERKESRGLHYNTDYPQRDDRNWLTDTVIDPISRQIKPATPGELPFRGHP